MLLRKKKATQPTGRLGESLAAEFLVRQRYVIIERNYRKPYGEVDIIAQDGDTVVFVEVKTRKSLGFGSATEAVDVRKQRHISRIAQEYMQSRSLFGSPARFDVIAVQLDSDNRPAAIDHIKNAFDCAP